MVSLTLKSERQIQADILNQIISLLGLNDVNKGSVLDILTAAVAREDFAQYIQMAKITRLVDLNALTGDDLDNKAFEYGFSRNDSVAASGTINILRPTGFSKVSTTFYAGSAAPIIGNTTINVNDASDALYGTSGTLIIGRGTDNEEEVTYSSAPTDFTNYWRFTVSALTKNHAVEETVILKQGNDETILAGTVVNVQASGVSPVIAFKIGSDYTLQSGEESLENVSVTADVPGDGGNISSYSITGTDAFPNPPFAGARAENPSKFTTGKNRESDDELRDRIKDHIQSLSRGTRLAILNAIVGLVDTESAKRVVSANVILPQDTDTPVKVYIDDGTGFEPSFASKGFETIIAQATGGETRIQLDLDPLVKAQIESSTAEHYDFSSGSETLIYNVGILSETITFNTSDFEFPESSTAEEIVTAINNRSTLIEARTSQSGTKIVITAKVDENETIQVTGGTANAILNFPTDLKETLFLYIDDVLMSKDGVTASITSQNQAPYNLAAIGAFPQTLTVIVDGKTANSQTVTFQSADFVDTGAATVAEIITVINAQLSGAIATAVNNGSQVQISSNYELSANSKIYITGGTINDATNGLNFVTSEVVGANKDYTLNRELGTIELTTPLVANQEVTVGSLYTRAYQRAALAENYSPGNTETLVISVDGGSNQTVTFDSTFSAGKSASDTADFINLQLDGATAYSREVGSLNYLEIRSNTYGSSTGSIEIKSSSTANASFLFTEDTEAVSLRPHKAYQETSNTGPFVFVEDSSLVVVVDNDIVNNTYSIVMDYDGDVTNATSTTVFRDSAFNIVFQSDDELNDFYLAFTSGANTSTATVTTVANVSGDTWRYTFSAPLPSFGNYAAGDLVKFTGLSTSANNGSFIITNIDGAGGYIDVTNADASAESGAAGTALVGQRRQISDYTASTGEITLGAALSSTPSVADTFIVIPSTVNNVVNFMNNLKVTSLSLKAEIEGSSQNTKIQIASNSEGSDGYIQITGGDANDVLGFSTSVYRGLQAYNYYTGLLDLVHKVIYGDDSDLVSYPGIGAAGITFQILAPTTTQVSVQIDVTLDENTSIAQVENDVASAVTGYINGLGVGKDIIIEEIRAAVIAISGIIDVEMTSPTSNVAIADNELGRIRASNVTIG